MKPLAESRGREWVWSRPRLLTRTWELRAGTDLIASLESTGLLGGGARAVTADGTWRFRHTGLMRGRIEVLGAEDDAVLGGLRPGWFGSGTLEWGERRLRWHRDDFWGRRWEFADEHDHPLVAFIRRPSFLRSTTAVEPSESGRRLAELPLLVTLGFHLLIMMQRQAQAGA